MSDFKVSQETDAAALAGTELVRVVQSGATLKTAVSTFATYFRGLINAFSKNQSVAFVELTDGATIATDASLSNNFHVVLGGNRTLSNPTNLTDGMVLNWIIEQGAGSHTLAFGSKFKFGGAYSTVSTAASAVDCISGVYYAANDVLLCNLVIGIA